MPPDARQALAPYGYRFDYRIEKAATEIAAISSSVNTALAVPPDDPEVDYEA